MQALSIQNIFLPPTNFCLLNFLLKISTGDICSIVIQALTESVKYKGILRQFTSLSRKPTHSYSVVLKTMQSLMVTKLLAQEDTDFGPGIWYMFWKEKKSQLYITWTYLQCRNICLDIKHDDVMW